MKCPNCNSESNGKFCPKCGNSMPVANSQTVTPQQPVNKNPGLNKTGVIAVCIVVGIILLVIGLITFAVFSLIRYTTNALNNAGSKAFSLIVDDFGNATDEFIDEFNRIENTYDESNDNYDSEDSVSYAEQSDYIALANGDEFNEELGFYNKETYCYYIFSDCLKCVIITDFNQSEYPADYDAKNMTIKIPEKINNYPVARIANFSVNDKSTKGNQYIKIIVPGCVNIIESDAFSFCDDVDEIEIKEGVTAIEESAFSNCAELKKIYIPKSVKILEDCELDNFSDYDYGDEEDSDIEPENNELTIYGKKNSAAEKYAKENNIKFVAE